MDLDEMARRIGDDPDYNFIVGAFLDGELAGTAGFFRERKLKTRHKGQIWGVYVTDRLRGEGVGRMLIQDLISRASGVEGLEQLVLGVTTSNTAAVRLYTSLGFQSFGCERNSLKIGNTYYDTGHMTLFLR
jgi:ribosomal protein S18 acetylase RimI-like enzyme